MHVEKLVSFSEDMPEEAIAESVKAQPPADVDLSGITEQINKINDAVIDLGMRVGAVENLPDDKKNEPPSEPMRREWNPKEAEHQAVTGEGDSKVVHFSHKNKDEVEKWLQKSGSSTVQE